MQGYWLRFVWHSLIRRFRRSAITFAGVGFSVAALVFLHAIMVGVGDTMVRSSVTLHTGHIRLSGTGDVDLDAVQSQVSDLPDVDRVLLRRTWQGILQRDRLRSSVAVYAANAHEERDQTVIAERLVAGTYLAAPGASSSANDWPMRSAWPSTTPPPSCPLPARSAAITLAASFTPPSNGLMNEPPS